MVSTAQRRITEKSLIPPVLISIRKSWTHSLTHLWLS